MKILHLLIFFSSLGPFPNSLRQVEVEIISNDICNQVHVYGGAVSSGMICAGFLTGKLDACEVRIDSNPQKWICWLEVAILTITNVTSYDPPKIKLWKREESIKRGNRRTMRNTPLLTPSYFPKPFVKNDHQLQIRTLIGGKKKLGADNENQARKSHNHCFKSQW